ncbi:MAG: MaoC/PaaZ C-terminal domain-containing protein [Desulfurellaceae bacterium]|nr:MaoC/PaaZ C-terminal domain-containing protein [Desulfurellaceae bacterium]
MGLNRDLLGKEYDPQAYVVSAEATTAYARAYNEDNAWFFEADRPAGILAPPLFGAVASWLSLMTVVTDAELNVDVLRLVHSQQDMRFFHPIIPGDMITSTARIVAIEEQPGGESLAVDLHCCNQTGETVQRITFTAFIRGQGRRSRTRVATGETPEPLHRVSQTIDADQAFRYANASGDRNPIHIDEDIAKLAGLPGIIVHGLCTLAFASKAIIDSVCEKDPRRLRRLSAGFARPVLPGQTITTAIWPDTNPGSYRYETVNPSGRAVIKPGYAEIGGVL